MLTLRPPPCRRAGGLVGLTIQRIYGAEERAWAEQKAGEVSGLPWDELARFEEQIEDVELPSGRKARVKTLAFWDMDESESDMYVTVRVYSSHGWRRYWPWKAVRVRGGETLPTQRLA